MTSVVPAMDISFTIFHLSFDVTDTRYRHWKWFFDLSSWSLVLSSLLFAQSPEEMTGKADLVNHEQAKAETEEPSQTAQSKIRPPKTRYSKSCRQGKQRAHHHHAANRTYSEHHNIQKGDRRR